MAKKKNMWSNEDMRTTIRLFGATVGAAGWIAGIAGGLLRAPASRPGLVLDTAVVCLSAAGVLLTGTFIWWLWFSGHKLSVLLVTETLLGASFLFGTGALVFIDARGSLPLAVQGSAKSGQPGGEIVETIGSHIPPEIAYVAPFLILSLMTLVWWPTCGQRMIGRHTKFKRRVSCDQSQRERAWIEMRQTQASG